jgi:hypothetical protein
MPLSHWLTIIAGSALLGGTIDFLIGKRGQKQVRDWMELKWYTVYEVAWNNFGKKEADLYIRVFDGAVGKNLFSKRRLFISLIVSTVTISCSIFIHFPSRE